MSTPISPRIRIALRAASWALLGVCVLYALFGGEYPVTELARMRTAVEEAHQERRTLEERTTTLRAQRDSLATDPLTIERIARERYGFVRADEVLYRYVTQ